ncbi:hypothetical protein [Phormidesmis priestleyi]
MRFYLSTVLVAVSSLAVWSTVFGDITLADVPKQPTPSGTPASQSNSQAVYVGSGCNHSTNTAYSLYQSSYIIGGGRTFTYPIKWEEVLDQGFCGRTYYVTKQETGSDSYHGGYSQKTSTYLTSAEWVFMSPTATDVSIAAYIPADNYQENLNKLRFPQIPIVRRVWYSVEVKPAKSSNAKARNCLWKEIDQSKYQNQFVDLGTCQVGESESIHVILRYDDLFYTNFTSEKVALRVVGDVVRFTPTTSKAQQQQP